GTAHVAARSVRTLAPLQGPERLDVLGSRHYPLARTDGGQAMNFDDLAGLSRAIAYEGYALYPYRASATKNRLRFTFGGVYPPAYSAAQSGSDRSAVHCECLAVAGAESVLHVSLRFLALAKPSNGASDGWQETEERVVTLAHSPLETACRHFEFG